MLAPGTLDESTCYCFKATASLTVPTDKQSQMLYQNGIERLRFMRARSSPTTIVSCSTVFCSQACQHHLNISKHRCACQLSNEPVLQTCQTVPTDGYIRWRIFPKPYFFLSLSSIVFFFSTKLSFLASLIASFIFSNPSYQSIT